MTEHRVHYRSTGGVRCGRRYWYNQTSVPSKVTCKSCKKLMAGEVE